MTISDTPKTNLWCQFIEKYKNFFLLFFSHVMPLKQVIKSLCSESLGNKNHEDFSCHKVIYVELFK